MLHRSFSTRRVVVVGGHDYFQILVAEIPHLDAFIQYEDLFHASGHGYLDKLQNEAPLELRNRVNNGAPNSFFVVTRTLHTEAYPFAKRSGQIAAVGKLIPSNNCLPDREGSC